MTCSNSGYNGLPPRLRTSSVLHVAVFIAMVTIVLFTELGSIIFVIVIKPHVHTGMGS